MHLVDIPAEIQVSGGKIEQYPLEDMQFKSEDMTVISNYFSVNIHIALRPSERYVIQDFIILPIDQCDQFTSFSLVTVLIIIFLHFSPVLLVFPICEAAF